MKQQPMARPVDDEPGPVPPEPIEPDEIKGPIGAYYRKLGGASWGHPLSYGRTFSGGEYVSFALPGQRRFFMAIFWSPRTGAHVLKEAIFTPWLRGGDKIVGHPTSDHLKTHDGGGAWQTFERGNYVWHPTTGAHEVHGDILTRYGQLGGSAWGYPTTDETGTPDKRGRFNHFRNVANGGELSIYWTPETGAHELFGYIRRAWMSYKGEGSLGYPTSGEMATHDGVGRWQTFEGGIYVWHPDTGAHEVHGDILTRYGQLGGSAWGYPITDEGDA
ncbi:MAG: LGFP repeat-containing protein, partial [bacterium]